MRDYLHTVGLIVFLLLGGFATDSAAAQPKQPGVILSCDKIQSIRYVAEPWEKNSRYYPDSDVRLAILDRLEPAAGAIYLAVLGPPFGHFGMPSCYLLSYDKRHGFADMQLAESVAAPVDDLLTFQVTAGYYDPSAERSKRWERLELRIDLKNQNHVVKFLDRP